MKLVDYNNLCQVKEARPEELAKLKELLKFKVDKPFFSKAYRNKQWDGTHSLFLPKIKAFPSGLLYRVLKNFKDIEVERKQIPCALVIEDITRVNGLTPMEHQIRTVEQALSKRRGLIESPTGSGKSLMIAMICKAIKGRGLICVPTKNLLHQTAKDISLALNEEVGKIGDGICDPDKRITVAIVASLQSMPKDERNHAFIIWDEAHHLAADTWFTFAKNHPAFFRYGFSADPLDMHKVKGDPLVRRAKIIGATGPLISQVEQAEMKDDGIIATADIRFVPVAPPDKERPPIYDSEYMNEFCSYICFNENILELIELILKSHDDESILIFVKHIHQGEFLQKNLPGSVFLHGTVGGSSSKASKIISKTLEDFKNEKIKVLIASSIFDEGTDMPNIDVLIMAAGGIAPTKQRLGRGLRRKHGKENKVIVYDMYQKGSEYTTNHAQRRMMIYKNDGHKVSVFKRKK